MSIPVKVGGFHVKTRRKKVNVKKYYFYEKNMKEYGVITN